ncbi:MAG TPA: hypothetical protein VN698_15585, partial [Bacteroidia bacterium]|nr:hypothetical protein [Bacteroidia bacterium]
NLAKEVFKNGEVITIWARYKPKIVKALISPFKKKFVADAGNDHLMNASEYSEWKNYKKKITKSGFISKIIYLLQSVDYLIQLNRFKKIINSSGDKILVIDRYLLDFIVDESVNYGDIGNNVITKLFLRRLRKLDHIFFIDTSEEVAISRKNDIPSLEYLRERKKIYKDYISKLDNGHIINNDFELNNAMNEIKRVLNFK